MLICLKKSIKYTIKTASVSTPTRFSKDNYSLNVVSLIVGIFLLNIHIPFSKINT